MGWIVASCMQSKSWRACSHCPILSTASQRCEAPPQMFPLICQDQKKDEVMWRYHIVTSQKSPKSATGMLVRLWLYIYIHHMFQVFNFSTVSILGLQKIFEPYGFVDRYPKPCLSNSWNPFQLQWSQASSRMRWWLLCTRTHSLGASSWGNRMCLGPPAIACIVRGR